MKRFDNIEPPQLRRQMTALYRAMTWLTWAIHFWLVLAAINAGLAVYAVLNGGVSWWSTGMLVLCTGLAWFTDKMLGVVQVEWLKTCPCPECDGFRREHGLNK